MNAILPCFSSRLSAPFYEWPAVPRSEKKRHRRRWGTSNLFLLKKNIVCAFPPGGCHILQTKEKKRKKNDIWYSVLGGLRLDRSESQYPPVNFSDMIVNIPQTHISTVHKPPHRLFLHYIFLYASIFYPDNRLTKCVVQFPNWDVQLGLITYDSGVRKTEFVLKRTREFHDWMSLDERGKVMRGLLSAGKLRLPVGGYISIFLNFIKF